MEAVLTFKARVRGHYRRTTHGGQTWVHEHRRAGDPAPPPPEAPKKPRKIKVPPPSWSDPGEPGNWRGGSTKEADLHWDAFGHGHVSEAMLAAVRKATPLAKVNTSASRAFYMPTWDRTARTITTYDDGNVEAGASTWRHEFGHHVDHCMSDDLGLEENNYPLPASRHFTDEMYADMRELWEVSNPRLPSNIRNKARVHKSFEEDYGRYQDEGMTAREALTRLAADEGFAIEELDLIIPPQITTATTWGRGSEAKADEVLDFLTAVDTRDAFGIFRLMDAVIGHASAPYLREYYHFQDYISAVTQRRVHHRAGHSAEYYAGGIESGERGYTHLHATEAYANWFDAEASPRAIWATLCAALTPQTYAAFSELTEEWLLSTEQRTDYGTPDPGSSQGQQRLTAV